VPVPNKTIYISENDVPLYERAQQLAGGNLSAAIARALRRFVDVEEKRQGGYREVTVRVGTGRPRRIQRFSGILLGEWRHPSGRRQIERFRVYRTPKGKLVLHVKRTADWAAMSDPETWEAWDAGESWSWSGPSEETLQVVDSVEELKDSIPAEFFEALVADSGRPAIEELDI
jgi:EXLDI family protein